jgi:hypothetical protein
MQQILGHVPAQRLFDVEEVVRPAFEAFPKNRQGKVPMQAIHSIVRSFLMEEHGWLIKGFEFNSMNATQLQGARLLNERAPQFVKALRDTQQHDVGYSLSDVVAVTAVVEHLILEESISLLRVAYDLNGASSVDDLSEKMFHEVLTSFLVLYRQGTSRNLTNKAAHQVFKTHARNSEQDWESLVKFELQAVASKETPKSYSFEYVARVARELALKYGRWQNSECDEIKGRLVELEIPGTGRVRFKDFHEEPAHAHFSLTEGRDYLRQIGALDELLPEEPKVLVANYVAASSNCIASSTYYAVCCLSECERIMNDLEERIDQAAEVPFQKLIDEVALMPSSTVEAPRQLPEELIQKARAIVSHHRGFVPLHSADFKQWLHFAFPNECPLPTTTEAQAEDSEGAAAEKWLGRGRIPVWQVQAQGALVEV